MNRLNLLLILLLAIVQMGNAQGFRWARKFGGVGFQTVYGLTVASNGDVITTGGFANTVDFDPGVGVSNFTSFGSSDIFVSRLDSLGNLVWTKQLGGTGYEAAQDIRCDTAGNIILSGDFRGTADFDPGPGVFNLTAPASWGDIFFVKLDPNGNFIWARAIGGAETDRSLGLVLDSAGNLYSVGEFELTVDFDPGPGSFPMTSAGYGDAYIAKLDASGTFIWAKQVGGSLEDSANDIVLDAAGNIIYGGSFRGVVDFDPGSSATFRTSLGSGDIFVSKLDPQGNFIWVDQMGGNSTDLALDVEVDPLGNIYYAGEFSTTVDFDPGPGVFNLTTPASFGACFSKLDPAGNFVWAKAILGPNTIPSAWVRDGAGDFVATGIFQNTTDFDPGPGTFMMSATGTFDAYVLKLDAMGNFIWALSFGNTLNDWGNAIAVDADDNIYSGGYFDQTVDFDPGGGIFNLTAIVTEDAYVHKLGPCTVAPPPPANTTAPQQLTVCTGYTTTLTASGTTFLTWHNGPTGGPILGTGGSFLTPPITANTTYYVQDSTCRGSVRTPISVTVLPNSSSSLTATACSTYLSPSGNHVWSTSGTYTDTLPNQAGCDSIITVNLSIQQTASMVNASTCSTYTSPSGNHVWSTSGTYNDTLPNVFGCDSVITINLSVLHNAAAISTTTCSPYTSPSGNHVWSTSGTYSDTLLNVFGCDSVITIALTVHSPSATTLSAIACDSYTGPSGQVWTTSGSYVDTLTNQAGCDSIVSVNLTVRNSSTSTVSATACDTYLSPSGQVWTSSGTYLDTLTNQAGCDSIITVQLSIGHSGTSTLNPVACNSYTSPSGQIWTSSGTYMDTLTTMSGCDSIITVHLTVHTVDASVTNTPPTITANATGATYQWIYCDSTLIPGATNQSYTATATGYYAVIVTENGCTDTSACQDVFVVGMEENGKRIQIYPNPTEGKVILECGGYCEGMQVKVRNALGQLLPFELVVEGDNLIVDLGGSAGIYLLELHGADGTSINLKIVKR